MGIQIQLPPDEAELLRAEGVNALEAKLIGSLSQLTGRASAIRDRAKAENRDLTERESEQTDKIVDQFNATDERLKELRYAADCAIKPPASYLAQPIYNPNAPNPNNFGVPMTHALPAPVGAKYNDMFAKRQAPRGGEFSSFAEFAMTALNDPLSPRLRNQTMTEGESASAGFMVPLQFIQELLDKSLEMEVVRPRASVLPFDTNSGAIPSFNYQDGTGGLRAGLELRWIAELGTNVPQKALTRNINMRILKGAIYCNASAELTEDAPLFATRLERAMTDAISVGLDHAWLFGSGAGVPLGIINSAGTIVVNKETSQTADTIVEDNVIKMAARLSPNSWRNAVWMASPTCLAQLYKLSQATGPNAGARTVLLREGDAGLTLMTKPLLITDACAPLGDKGDLVLADWSRYLIGLRKEASLQTSIHAGWLNDEVGFRVILRMNGLPEMEAPTKLRDGNNTVAHFVTLETRA